MLLQAAERVDAWAAALTDNQLLGSPDSGEIDEDVEQLFRANHIDEKKVELCDMTATDLADRVAMGSVSFARLLCHECHFI